MGKLELFTAIACVVSMTLNVAWVFYPPIGMVALFALGVQMASVITYITRPR